MQFQTCFLNSYSGWWMVMMMVENFVDYFHLLQYSAKCWSNNIFSWKWIDFYSYKDIYYPYHMWPPKAKNEKANDKLRLMQCKIGWLCTPISFIDPSCCVQEKVNTHQKKMKKNQHTFLRSFVRSISWSFDGDENFSYQ